MNQHKIWDPFTDWKHVDIKWAKVDIAKEDLARFTRRSDIKGLAHALGFLLLVFFIGSLAYYAFSRHEWILLALALYVHGSFYGFFGNALHELGHNTVFASRVLSKFFIMLFGWLYWPYNPYLYRLSHQFFHHRYTLHQGSDGEDVPNYLSLNPRLFYEIFLHVFQLKSLVENLGRLFSLKPASKGWRGRAYALDSWEKFVLSKASESDRREVYRFALICLVGHLLFVGVCIYFKLYFLPVLVTLAPFYGSGFLMFMAGVHQHTACEPNHSDFRISCGDAILDPITSFLYWRMEYHIEHHMFASIPCYNLKKFSRFVADQLPPKEWAIPRIAKLNRICREKYGSVQNWRDNFGLYKGY